MYVFFQKMNKNRHTCKKNLGSNKSSEANGPNVIGPNHYSLHCHKNSCRRTKAL